MAIVRLQKQVTGIVFVSFSQNLSKSPHTYSLPVISLHLILHTFNSFHETFPALLAENLLKNI